MNIALYAGMFRRNQDGATKTLYRLVEGTGSPLFGGTDHRL
jgi:hypothetical protein